MEFVLNDLIWIYPHEELSWCPGVIVKVESDSYLVTCYNSEDDSIFRVNKADALPVHPSCLSKVSDLLSLGEFNEGALLHNIRGRYLENSIYTSVGTPILISLNPYSKLPIYSSKTADLYRKSAKDPHLFLMAEKAYSALREGNQSIIISGESGSGKTEAAKIILSYLAGSASDGRNNLAKQVLDTNPILEAFGNAKTLRNDNSSRFGKFIEIHFDSSTLKLLSARIQNYLLEKSRIVNQQEGERNYHFFYQICAGATDEERAMFKIYEAEFYNYLNQSNCLTIEEVDDAQNYRQTRECMTVLGFTEDEQNSVLSTVMGVLHLGNVRFEGTDHAEVVDDGSLDTASELLGVSREALAKVLTTRVIIDPTNNQEIIMKQNCSLATYTRDATSKAIYGKLFSWLVERINKTIFVQQKTKSKIIGLLDIYGFEVFDSNSFEQFCINYANEKLQQHFNHHMFKLEQAEYSKEKIKWDHISYDDNQECIDLIEKSPIGIISLLDEQCKLQKGTDKQFLTNVSAKLTANSKLCNPGQFASEYFGVGHYAGNVFYNVQGFLEKNKDSLNPQLAQALEKSSILLVRDLFLTKGKKVQGSLSALTLATQFKTQLADLIKALSGSTPTYIRCIKPNSEKMPRLFDSKDVQRQLRCAGMLECIRIRKAGYSVRRSLKEFIDKYSLIVRGFKKGDANLSSLGKTLLEEMKKCKKLKPFLVPDKKLIQIGITMVFMKDELRQALDIRYAKKASKFAVIIQKNVKCWVLRKKYVRVLKAVQFIQKHAKEWVWKIIMEKKMKTLKRVLGCMIWKNVVNKKKKALINVKRFLSVSSSKVYISYFKPVGRKYVEPAEEVSKEEETFNFEKKKVGYSKDLTLGQSSVIDTVQREVRTLNYLLQREKAKTKTFQEEVDYYKDLYSSTLSKLEKLELERSSQGIEAKPQVDESKFKKDIQKLQKDLKEKVNENSVLKLKIESVQTTINELEESNKELKGKQATWEQKLYAEMRKNALEVQELKQKATHGDVEKIKSEKSALEKEIRSLKVALRQAESEISNLKGEILENSIKIKDFEESEVALKDQIKALQSHVSLHSSNLSAYKEESNTATGKRLQDMARVQESLQNDLEALQEEKENLEIEVQKLTLSEEHFKQELQKNQKLNKEKTLKIKELENEIENLHHEKLELTRAKIELQTIKKNPVESSETIKDLQMQIRELNQEIEDLIKELEAAKQIHGTLLTLVKIKNNELDVLKQSGSSELLANLEEQEQGLLEELERQTRTLNQFSDDDD